MPALSNTDAIAVMLGADHWIASADVVGNAKHFGHGKVSMVNFDAHSDTFEEIRTLLNAVDINRLTPVEALLKLQEVKAKVK